MQKAPNSLRAVSFATIVLALLLSATLGANYYCTGIIEEKSLQQIETAFALDRDRIDLYLKHIHIDLNSAANHLIVKAFFNQRSISEQNHNTQINEQLVVIRRILADKANHILSLYDLKVPPQNISTSLVLYDRQNSPLVSWPNSDFSQDKRAIKRARSTPDNSTVDQRQLYLYAPVKDNNDEPGYLVATINLDSLAKVLERPNHSPLDSRQIKPLQLLLISNTTSVKEVLPYTDLTEKTVYTLASSFKQAEVQHDDYPHRAAIFTNPLKNYPLTLIHVMDADNLLNDKAPLMHFATASLLSIIIIVTMLRLVRSTARSQALNESLQTLKENKKKLHQKNEEIRLIIDAAKLGTWVKNASTGEFIINEGWAQMLGFNKDEIIPNVESWVELVHPDDWPRVEALWATHLKGESERFRADYRLRHKQGHYIWVRDAGQVISHTADGSPREILGIHLEITALQNALRDAQEARQEADSVISSFLDSLLVVNQDLTIMRVNKETCSLLGYQDNAIIGQPVTNLFQEDAASVAKYFRFYQQPDYKQQQALRNIELTLKKHSGEQLPVSINLSALRNDHDEIIGVVAGAKDVSALKTALNEAQAHRHFVENILHIIPGGLLVIDNAGNILQHNQTFAVQLDLWSREYAMPTAELRENILSSIKDKLSLPSPVEFSIATPCGELFIALHASETELQGTIGRVLFIHDVTERHHAEAQQKLLSTVFEQTSEGILVSATNGTIEFANIAISAMSGYLTEELIGQDISIFKSGAHSADFYKNIWATLRTERVWKGSLTNRSKQGEFFEVELTISPVRDKNNKLTHYVSLWRDVRQERTLQQQLLQAQKLESIGQLAAGIAHEINTPIQYIQNNLAFFRNTYQSVEPLIVALRRWLAEQQPDEGACIRDLRDKASSIDFDFIREEVPEGLEDSLTGIEHVTRIVAAMKEFSHPGSGTKEPAQLNKLIDNALIVTRNEWKYCATVDLQLEPDLPLFLCDASAWSQVLLNLIVNAADAIKEKQSAGEMGKITITTKAISRNTLELTITDTGSGIEQANLHKIFDLFFTTKGVGKGSGQGLSIVYDIVVNKHGGTVHCDSVVDDHTTFTIRVPTGQEK